MRVDGRRTRVVRGVTRAGRFLVASELRAPLGPLRPGRHRLELVAVDRADNRSEPAVRRFAVR